MEIVLDINRFCPLVLLVPEAGITSICLGCGEEQGFISGDDGFMVALAVEGSGHRCVVIWGKYHSHSCGHTMTLPLVFGSRQEAEDACDQLADELISSQGAFLKTLPLIAVSVSFDFDSVTMTSVN